MIKRGVLLVMFLVLVLNCYANEYYIDKDSIGGSCSDTNSGTMTEPFCTIDKANQVVQPGDLIYLRQGTYENDYIKPGATGTESARITYTNYDSEQVIITNADYGFHLDQKSYITIKGINFWNLTRNFYIETGNYNHIENNWFLDMGKRSIWCSGRIWKNSHHNQVTGNVFSRWGFESSGSQDFGCLLDIANEWDNDDYCHHNIIERNNFSYGGHHIMAIRGKFNVIRNNWFHNEEWYDCSRTNIGNLCGNRNIITGSDFTYNQYNLYESNTFAFSGVPPDQETSSGFSLRSPNNIIRNNIFYDNDGPGLDISTSDSDWSQLADSNHIYNNVFYHNGYNKFPNLETIHNNVYRFRTGISFSQHRGPTIYNNSVKNNIFYMNNYTSIYFYYTDENLQTLENNWETGDPLFINILGPDPYDPDCYDFHLQGDSQCIDAGGFLTTIKSPSGTGSVFNVTDSGYFIDGWGIIEGDMIQLEGDTAQYLIFNIDYDNDEITIDRPMTWYQGQGVSLPYSGSLPDIGAYEYEITTCVSADDCPDIICKAKNCTDDVCTYTPTDDGEICSGVCRTCLNGFCSEDNDSICLSDEICSLGSCVPNPECVSTEDLILIINNWFNGTGVTIDELMDTIISWKTECSQ